MVIRNMHSFFFFFFFFSCVLIFTLLSMDLQVVVLELCIEPTRAIQGNRNSFSWVAIALNLDRGFEVTISDHCVVHFSVIARELSCE